jgi:hypothetical protein
MNLAAHKKIVSDIKKISFVLLIIGTESVRLRRDSPMQKRNYLDSFSAGRYAEQE